MKKLVLTAAAFAVLAAQALTVTGVSARQRWPWNNLVDIDFTINGDSGEAYYIDISATAAGGEKRLVASSFTTEPIAATGENRIVWDLGADYPDFKADDLAVTVTATPFSDSTPLYLVVDISGGTSATKWPVRYTTTAPTHTAGVADPCKTTELWLKRVKAKGATVSDGNASGQSATYQGYYAAHTCTLTNDFYLGVFPLTQAQCSRIYGSALSTFTADGDTRPADSIHPANHLRSPYFDSSSPETAVNSGIVKNVQDRTGMKFDLPTEWQWVFACKAGATGNRYEGASESNIAHKGNSDPTDSTSSCYNTNYTSANRAQWPVGVGTSYVDAYDPNPWGFYSMLGNVWETCLNQGQTLSQNGSYTDLMGDSGTGYRARRGSCWSLAYSYASTNWRSVSNPNDTNNGTYILRWGARICLTVGK